MREEGHAALVVADIVEGPLGFEAVALEFIQHGSFAVVRQAVRFLQQEPQLRLWLLLKA